MMKITKGPPVRLLASVAVVNGLVCIFAPAMVLARGSASAPIGSLVLWMAAIALALTPLQLTVMGMVIGPRLKGLLHGRHTRKRIEHVLTNRKITTAFQPIFDLTTMAVLGVEALSRFGQEPEIPPDVWFADAEDIGRGLELELLAVQTALETARSLPGSPYVGVNVSPTTLASPELLEILSNDCIPTSRIVVEITEHTSIQDYTALLQPRAQLRQLGIRLAIDDAGSGYASLQRIVALTPDIIKLDRALIVGVEHDKARQALIAAVVMFALESGAAVVGEGVETLAELDALADLGVDAAQGYVLGRPTTSPDDWQTWNTPMPTRTRQPIRRTAQPSNSRRDLPGPEDSSGTPPRKTKSPGGHPGRG